jgi:F-type H+-transporting ATPase subunit delta
LTTRTAANRYARALLEVGLKEKADLSKIDTELAEFSELVVGHPTLEKVLLNPAVPTPRKRALVAELTGRARTQPVVAKLLALLADRDRLIVLPELVAAYRERLQDHLQIVRAEVTTALPLSPERTTQIERTLASATGRKVTLSTHVDPSIIGGVVARVGSTVFDGSVTNHLQRMKQRLEESV